MRMGIHLLMDGFTASDISASHARKMMDGICERHHFTILEKMIHVFEPHGLTCLYMLSESHFSIHTWPENDSCAIDIFCCRELTQDDIDRLIRDVADSFHLTHFSQRVVARELDKK